MLNRMQSWLHTSFLWNIVMVNHTSEKHLLQGSLGKLCFHKNKPSKLCNLRGNLLKQIKKNILNKIDPIRQSWRFVSEVDITVTFKHVRFKQAEFIFQAELIFNS